MSFSVSRSRLISWSAVIVLILFSFLLRARTLTEPTSFWSDEALTASFAQELAFSPTPIQTMRGLLEHTYQPLQIISMAASFRILGASEVAARFPSVLWSTAAVYFAYLFVRNISSARAALIGALFLSSSQLILGQTTQAKPYAALLALFFILLWLFTLLERSKRKANVFLAMILVVLMSAGFHVIGILYLIFPIISLLTWHKELTAFVKQYAWQSAAAAGLGLLLVAWMGLPGIALRLIGTPGVGLLEVNNTAAFRFLFFVQYAWVTLPAAIALWSLRQKQKSLFLAIVSWAAILTYAWVFIQYSRNIRYLVPLFGFLFVMSGVFWEKALAWADKKNMPFLLVVTVLVLLLGTNKFVLKPERYYSPNADFHADVQNADYRGLYLWLEHSYPNVDDLVIVNNVFDAEKWYMDRHSDAYFSKTAEVTGSYLHPFTQVPVYSSVEEFQDFRARHPEGIFIVEDWESYLPEAIKSYVKNNLTEVYRVSCLPQSPSDCWPLAVYTWKDSAVSTQPDPTL